MYITSRHAQAAAIGEQSVFTLPLLPRDGTEGSDAAHETLLLCTNTARTSLLCRRWKLCIRPLDGLWTFMGTVETHISPGVADALDTAVNRLRPRRAELAMERLGGTEVDCAL